MMLVSIIGYKAEELLEELKDLYTINCIIHPVFVELLRVEKTSTKAIRQAFLDRYKFITLQLSKPGFDNASDIQLWLSDKGCNPSPTDLYLGGKLASTILPSIVLLTSNLTDFQYPLFTREAAVILQNNKSSKTLHFLSINKQILRDLPR